MGMVTAWSNDEQRDVFWRTDGRPIKLPLDMNHFMYSIHLYLDALRKGIDSELNLFMGIMQEQGYPETFCSFLYLSASQTNEMDSLVNQHFGIITETKGTIAWMVNDEIIDMRKDGAYTRYLDRVHELIYEKYQNMEKKK